MPIALIPPFPPAALNLGCILWGIRTKKGGGGTARDRCLQPRSAETDHAQVRLPQSGGCGPRWRRSSLAAGAARRSGSRLPAADPVATRRLGEAAGISGEQVALLTDGVLLAQGKPQRYGSQYQGNPGERPVIRPVEDPARLDERRARMHMMPSATYACFLERMSTGPGAANRTP